ncbi:MAG: type II secretion system F family protein [Candidatus Omnitrophota bacterium]|nr:MAG: type II secretion system F family protein [Candidatus Omnitrophota bacterium]
MPTYIYKARDATGKPVKGRMAAKTAEELVDKLRKMGYMTTQVTESLPLKMESLFDRLRPINAEDMIMFNVQLANMLNAGISILDSLGALARQLENKKLKEAIGGITRSIEGGDNFSQALARYPLIFPKLFVNMVKAGEASGKLDNILLRYAEYFERQSDLKQKVKAALFYPTVLLFAGLTVTLFIVTFIIPQFAQVFIKSNVPLPIPTLILFKVGVAIKKFWYVGVLLVISAWIGIKNYINTERGRLVFDRFKLKVLVLGPLHRKAAISGFARTFGTLSASGVPILESLDITKDVVGNEVLSRVIASARKAVEKGQNLSEPLKISEEFPPDVIQMISVGEESGSLDRMLNKIADFYDMSVGYAIKKLTTILEPLFLVVMGCMVGFIMASMLLPIFDMIKILKR